MDESKFVSLLTQFKKDIIGDLNCKLEKINCSIDENKTLIVQKIASQEERLNNIERDLRKKNIIIHGLAELDEQSYFKTEKQVINLLKNKLKIEVEESEIDLVRRIGRKSEGKVRPILVTFTTYRRKVIVLKNKKLLKDQNIFITEDYPKSVLEIRKNLQVELTEIRKSGKFAFINYDKIVIREDREMKYKNKRRLSPESPKRSSAQEKKEEKIEKRHKIGKSLNQKHNITTFFGSNNEGNLIAKAKPSRQFEEEDA